MTIIAHSLSASISLLYAGIYPNKVEKLVAIEGLGISTDAMRGRHSLPMPQQMSDWIEGCRSLAKRDLRRVVTIDEVFERMMAQNAHLTPEQGMHLTIYGRSAGLSVVGDGKRGASRTSEANCEVMVSRIALGGG
ncbi:hypothetical protein [Novosphingobium sp. 9U]|uniref:hypothetical protein n=1 Tax=Novosphingobium sp. 9U TaxID=2653158 RepID=UPI0012F115F2|nr:hypothetical protein [Novosphingobium sp. 9U]VWX50280.1 hypothetical protein NOVOSPHI9U_260269 [Novosphingobium sp. 9U]